MDLDLHLGVTPIDEHLEYLTLCGIRVWGGSIARRPEIVTCMGCILTRFAERASNASEPQDDPT